MEKCISGPVVDGKRTHASCNIPHGETKSQDTRQTPPLPTRVIDVGKAGDTPRLYVPRLESSTSGSPVHADYLILSYCWGEGNATARTTKHNVDQRRAGLNMAELPQTILDAIDVTRAMGQRYLWVDAVCIIQHNPGEDSSDWANEAPLMGQYYQNALCSLAAAAAEDSRDGFLKERPAEIYPFTALSLGVWRDPESDKPKESFLYPTIPTWPTDVAWAPLYTRGWTLQERALSNRILHFGRGAVYWECAELRASEFLPNGLGDRISISSSPRDMKETHLQLDSLQKCTKEEALGSEWIDLASKYSSMNFTYNKDKLLAIYGIISRIQLFFPDRCVAGCFESQLISNMAWYASGDEVEVKVRAARIAPSWSWVSSSSSIMFVWTHPEPWDATGQIVQIEDFPNNPEEGSSPQSPNGTLKIKGLRRKMDLIQCDTTEGRPTMISAMGSSGGTSRNDLSDVRLYFDEVRHVPQNFEMTLEFFSICSKMQKAMDGIITRGCLVISPTKGAARSQTYERIGWAEFYEVPELISEWKDSTISIV